MKLNYIFENPKFTALRTILVLSKLEIINQNVHINKIQKKNMRKIINCINENKTTTKINN